MPLNICWNLAAKKFALCISATWHLALKCPHFLSLAKPKFRRLISFHLAFCWGLIINISIQFKKKTTKIPKNTNEHKRVLYVGTDQNTAPYHQFVVILLLFCCWFYRILIYLSTICQTRSFDIFGVLALSINFTLRLSKILCGLFYVFVADSLFEAATCLHRPRCSFRLVLT